MGEGWHNNHHHYPSAARQGFYWWEFDLSYCILKVLSWVGIVWDLRQPTSRALTLKRIDANVGRELCRVTARSDAEARGLRE